MNQSDNAKLQDCNECLIRCLARPGPPAIAPQDMLWRYRGILASRTVLRRPQFSSSKWEVPLNSSSESLCRAMSLKDLRVPLSDSNCGIALRASIEGWIHISANTMPNCLPNSRRLPYQGHRRASSSTSETATLCWCSDGHTELQGQGLSWRYRTQERRSTPLTVR